MPREAGIDPTWVAVDWWREGGSIERLPLLPQGLKSRLRGAQQTSVGLGDDEYDVVFVGPWGLFLGNGPRFRRQPYVLGLDSTEGQRLAFGGPYGYPSRTPGAEWLKWKLRREIYHGALLMFAWSRWAAEGLIEEYQMDPALVHIVPPGIDLRLWPYQPHPVDGDVRLLFVGGDFHRKGGDLLLAWADATRLAGWQLDIVTRDAVSTSNPRVRIHRGLAANDPALRQLYRQANLFVLPTRADCFSLASIEAMATGLPVVVSDVGGISDIVRNGETGYLIRPGDAGALAFTLEAVIENRDAHLALGRAARLRVEARFDIRRTIIRTGEILRTALAAHGR